MARIPEETIQSVINSTDIVDLIGHHVKLKRAGTMWKGLCPFHNEKTPSFTVNPARNTYHCFGCQAGGTAIRFLMEFENLTFPESVRRLADRAGIKIVEEDDDPAAAKARLWKQRLLALHRESASWFHELLLHHPLARGAREYLQRREINEETAQRWLLGYAPESTNLLLEWAKAQGFEPELLQDGGLLLAPDADDHRPNRPIARFRDRLMFPIATETGDIVAFSGRVLQPDAKTAKYLNSPETRIFLKGGMFFGLDKTKRPILRERRAILCEGQIDLISAYEAGVQNVVAPLGTAFTPQHAQILLRHADEVILCYDSDPAGFKAGVKTFGALAPSGLMVKVAALPKGEDPDSLIRKNGADAFRAIISEAKDFYQHQIEIGAAGMGNDLRSRVRFASEIAETISIMPQQIARDTAIQAAAIRLGIANADLRSLVMEANRENRRQASIGSGPKKEQPPKSNLGLPPQNPASLQLCKLLMTEPDVRAWIRHHDMTGQLADIPGTELLSHILSQNLTDEDVSLDAWLASQPPAEQTMLCALLTTDMPTNGLEEAKHLCQRLELDRLQTLRAQIHNRLRSPNLDSESRNELFAEAFTLDAMIKNLKEIQLKSMSQFAPAPATESLL
jgi:DNA primase